MEIKRFWRRERDTAEVIELKQRLGELGITKTRGPDRGFAPDFPTPGPVTPRKAHEERVIPHGEYAEEE